MAQRRQDGGEPLRVLVVHGDLLCRLFEASEVWQMIAGLLRASSGSVEVHVSDGLQVWSAQTEGSTATTVPDSARPWSKAPRPDVAVIFGTMPVRRHLWSAVRLRARRIPLVFAPMCLLTDDFAQASWFRRRGALFRRAKPLLVVLLRQVWRALAGSWIVATEEERRQTHLARGRCVHLPWPYPDTELAASAAEQGPLDGDLDREGPVAFISRLDVPRKGIDRLCAWVEAHAADLPRPAVVLMAPRGGDFPDSLPHLMQDGLIEWDATSTGAGLRGALKGCRGVITLSRWDAQPRVLREATLLHLPTISTSASHMAEINAFVGAGEIVDGDVPGAIQTAFERIGQQKVNGERAQALLDPMRHGEFLWQVLTAAAARRRPDEDDYYRSTVATVRGGHR
jgi:hypothetical protein